MQKCLECEQCERIFVAVALFVIFKKKQTNKPCLSFSFRIFSMSPALFLTRPKKSYFGKKNKNLNIFILQFTEL